MRPPRLAVGLLFSWAFSGFAWHEPAAHPALAPKGGELVTEVVANNLVVPWALAFAPDGRLFFNERVGRVRVISGDGVLLPDPVITLDVVQSTSMESGLLGLAVDPDFATNHYLFVYYTYGSPLKNKVDRLIVDDETNTATIDVTVVDLIPGASIHDGGRIKFGPDNYLYIGTGDATCVAAQNLSSLGGKILRIDRDGNGAPDNPFPEAPLVYTYGHRNVQGLAWDQSGQLYSTEHGPTGDCGYGGSRDEVNIIYAPGDPRYTTGNYGWPLCAGQCGDPRWVDPIRLYFPETAAPSGATFCVACPIARWDASLFHTTMGFPGNAFARHLHRILFDPLDGVTILDEEILFRPTFGRLRDVIQGPDGLLYFSTSNRDGRGADILGQPGHEDDDKIIRIRPL
jgi:glucose/arabinose dehydrogenase